MAAPASPEASEIRRRGRQRLIGAIALVMLLVVFVPMILDSQPRDARPGPALDIPSKENAPPLPAPPPKAPAVAAEPQAEAKPGVKPPDAPPEAAPKAAPKTTAKPAEPKAATTAPQRLEGFAVQVGAFRDEARLSEAREKLAAAGVVHYTERLDSQGGALTRLRAGPFPTREAAEAVAAKLKRASLEGKVVTLP